jgi:hypothetical protein
MKIFPERFQQWNYYSGNKIYRWCHSRVGGNPGVVQAEAGDQLLEYWIPYQVRNDKETIIISFSKVSFCLCDYHKSAVKASLERPFH